MKRTIILTLLLVGGASLSLSAGDVKETWDKTCAKCHGPDGKGDTKLGKKSEVKDMTDAKWQADLKDDKACKSIKEGIKDGDKVRMKPAEGLTDDDIKALVQHVRTFKK